MTMLPDIDQQDWDAYEQANLADDLKRKMDGFGLQHAIGEKIAGLQSLIGGAPPEPAPVPPPPPPPEPPTPSPPVEQGLANVGGWTQPPPEPTPTPDMSAPSLDMSGFANTPQPPSIPPVAAPNPAPTQPSPASGDLSDWYDQIWQQGIGAVAQAGGNVQQFSDDLWQRLQGGVSDANDAFSQGLSAAHGAGANLQQFALGYDPTPPPQPTAPPTSGGFAPTGTSGSLSGVPDWLTSLIARNAPELANDPEFIRTVAAGAKAESGWDVNRIQNGFQLGSGGGARGLFQFDMGGMGAGIPEQQLLGDRGAELQASRIVPLYAKAYASAPAELSGAEKASWVAAQAERPAGFTDPNSAARRNYASAFNEISAGPSLTPTNQLGRVGGWAQGATLRPATQLSQFGNPQLSADEAYAACGPAAAVRFAQMYGRNPTLREATDLAATVGWTSSQGMAGIGSQKALMDKLGVATRVVGADVNAMAAEAATGNPVTISTPGHYFFADGYDPNTGAFHVGQSGLDLKGGSEWMTAQQMTNRMGAIQGALFADNPRVPSPSLAQQETSPLDWLGRQKDAALSKLGFPPPEEPSVIAAHVDSSHPDVQQLDRAIDDSVVAAHSPQPIADELTQTMASVGSPVEVAGAQAQAEPNVWDKIGSGISDVFKNAFGASGTADNPLSGAQALGMGPPGATGIGNEVASAFGQGAAERLGGIQRIETGNPLIDIPLAAPTAAASAFGTGVKAGLDVTNELLPTTHLGRIYEGLAGDVRRDPEYNALLQQQVDLTSALANASTGAEQQQIRNLLQQNQAAVDARGQAVRATGPQDLESAYRAGLASPDRANVEAISSLAMLPVSGAGAAESAPTALRAFARATDPISLALTGAREVSPVVSPALRQAGAVRADVAARAGGAAAGGYAGYQSTPEDASLQERLLRTGGAALAGLGATEAALRAPRLWTGSAVSKAATGNAELDRVLDMHAAQDRQAPLLSDIAERASSILGLGGRTGELDRAAADRFAYINQMTGRAKQALGSAFTPEMDAEAYVAAYAGRGARALQRIRDDITPALDLVRENDDLANLNALRKLERNREVATLYGGSRTASAGVNDVTKATDAINALEASMGPTRWATLRRANQMINDATATLLLDRADAGLIDRDLANRLIAEQPHYNPTVLMRHLDEGAGMGQGDKFTVTNNFLRRLAAEGSADDTEKPISSLIRHFVQNDVLMNRNQTANAILGAAQEDPTLAGLIKRVNPMRTVTGPEIAGPGGPARGTPGDIATVLERKFGDQPGLVSVYEDGKRVYYQVPEGLEQAMKGLDAKTAGVVANVFKTLNAPLRWGATAASPPFLVTNALADAVTTYLREGAGTAARIPMGWWEAAKQGDLYQNYMRAGGGMESLFQRSGMDTLMQRPENWEQLTRESGGLIPQGPEDISRWIGDALKLNWIRRAGEVIEQGPRLATFERHLAAGESPIQAAVAGRRATVDFSRAGDALREANMLSLFLNARTQGTLNVARTLRDNPESRMRLATLAAITAGINHQNRQDPAYWDIPEYERRQNAIVMLPGSEKDPSGPGWKKINRISIPLREWSMFTDPLNHALSQLDANPEAKDPRTWQDLAQNEISNLIPVTGNDPSSAAAGLLPAPLRSPVELAANRRFYTGLPIVPREYEGLPPSAQFNERTSLLGRKLGETLGISPMQFDFLVQENLGTLGRTGLGAIDTLAGKPSEGVPVIGGLTSGIVRNYGGQIAADKYEKLDQLMGQFQEPIAESIRQLPDYTAATTDRQNDMLRGAQLHLRDTLREQLGITGSTKDTGLPQKYPGVTDPQEAVRIDRAVSRWNAYKQDPAHAPKPTDDEARLGLLYGSLVSPLYRIESQQDEQQNRAIRSMVEDQLATRQGR